QTARCAVGGALQAGVEHDAADMTARQHEALGEKLEVELARVHAGRNHAAPDAKAIDDARGREFDDEPQAPQEGFVEILLAIRRKNRQSLEALHALEQVAD